MTDAGPSWAGRSAPELIWINRWQRWPRPTATARRARPGKRRGTPPRRRFPGGARKAHPGKRRGTPPRRRFPVGARRAHPGKRRRPLPDVGSQGELGALTSANDADPSQTSVPRAGPESSPRQTTRDASQTSVPGGSAESSPWMDAIPAGRSHPGGGSTQSSPWMDAIPAGRSHPGGGSTQSYPWMDAMWTGVDLRPKLVCRSIRAGVDLWVKWTSVGAARPRFLPANRTHPG